MKILRRVLSRVTIGLSMLAVTCAASAANLTLNDISWLSGCWKAKPEAGRVNNMEQWSKPFGNAMLGVGAELKNGQVASWEHMKIEVGKDAKLQLHIRPHNQKEAVFTMTGDKPDVLVFENPENAFPQKVTYRREKDGSLEMRIDGKVKDSLRAALFPMVRMPCD